MTQGDTDIHFRSLILEAPMAMALYTGMEMTIGFANTAMLKLWGKDESVIGKTLHEAIPELEGQPFLALLQSAYTTGIPYTTEEDPANLVVDGHLQTFYFNFSYKPVRNANGEIYAILNMAADVTSHVKAKEALRKAEERVHFALEAAELGTWELDPQQNIVTWDDRCRELHGFLRDESIAYQDVLKYIHPEDMERVNQSVAAALDPQQGAHYDIKFRTVGEDQKLRWLHAKGKAYFDETGAVRRFSGTCRDISEEVRKDNEQQKLLTLVENSAELMSILELDGRNSYLNKAGRDLLGFENEQQVLDTPISDLHTPEHFEQVSREVVPSILKDGRWSGEMLVKHLQTGEIFPVHNSSIRIDDPLTGDVVAVGAVMRDLRPERSSREEQRKLLFLIDNSYDFISLSDLDGNVTYVNKAGQQMLGIKDPRDIMRVNTDYVMPEEIARIRESITVQLMQEGRWSGEIAYRHFITGEAIPVHATSIIVYDPGTGKPQGRASIARDLRQENAAKNKLKESAEKLTSILEGLPQIAYTATPDGIVDYFSRKWYGYTGLTDAYLSNVSAEFIAPEDREAVAKQWMDDVANGRPHRMELRLKRFDGMLRWHLSAALPIYNTAGEIVSWAGTLTDIHEQKELQRQKDDFLGIASHELKTPVTSIKAYTQVLELMLRKAGDNRKADMVLKMDTQLNRLTSLIGDLLDVTKIHTGKLQFNDEAFDFSALARELTEDLQRTTSRHTLTEDAVGPVTVFADKYRIGQVITNLVSNAIKYSPEGGEILVRTRVEDGVMIFSVKDPGIGIAADKKERVFEQFYRVSGEKEHTFPGLGLGLYISSEIIKREGGRIWVESNLGEGAIFNFTLPLKADG